MKLYNLEGKKQKEIDLPSQFKEKVREDIIKKAFLVIQANKRNSYGAMPKAGMRQSTKLSRRRKVFKSAYGRGISRVPRKTILRRGSQFIWVGAQAPGTVGGRRAHPPKSEKTLRQKMNIKERRKAIRCGIAATNNKELLEKHGYKAESFCVVDKIESISKTKDLVKVLKALKLELDLERSFVKRIRAGLGKLRGRKYKKAKGPLIVVSGDCKLTKALGNLAGFDICKVNLLNVGLLAPGGQAGRLTIWSEKALERLDKENLFK